jgi:predicted nucleotidyltransferase
MLSETHIRAAAQRAVQAIGKPCRIILFGSYARGNAEADSDLDLLVVEPEISDPTGEYRRIREAIGSLGVGVDLLLYTEAEFEQRKAWWTTPVYWAAREGRVIGESAV